MKPLYALYLGLALAATPALAAVSYQPSGTEIPLSEAVNEMVVKEKPANVVFDHGTVFIELGDAGTPRAEYAKAADVEVLAREIDAQRDPVEIKSGQRFWYKSWNKLTMGENAVYDVLNAFRSYANDSKDMDIAESTDDLYRTVITIYGLTNEPMSITGDLVTTYNTSSGYSGGAHDWAGSGFKAQEWVSDDAVSVLAYVNNEDLLKALRADPYLRKMAKKAGKAKEFAATTQLTDLDRLLAEASFGGSEDFPVSWAITPMEQFQKFAIWDYDVKTGEVLVRFGLEYSAEVVRGAFEQVGVRVKAKPEFAKLLAGLKAKGEGLFMKDVAKAKRP